MHGCSNGNSKQPKTLTKSHIKRCLTTEYQHASEDARFGAQKRLDGQRRWILSPKILGFKTTSISALTFHQKFLEKTMCLTHEKLQYVGAGICQLVVQMIVILGLQKWKKKIYNLLRSITIYKV